MSGKYKWLGSDTDGPRDMYLGVEVYKPGSEVPPGLMDQQLYDHYCEIGEMELVVESTAKQSRLIVPEVVEAVTPKYDKPKPAKQRRRGGKRGKNA